MNRHKLKQSEIDRLQKHIAKNGGQQKVGEAWGVNASTLSRILHGHHAPSPLLAQKLVAEKIVLVK